MLVVPVWKAFPFVPLAERAVTRLWTRNASGCIGCTLPPVLWPKFKAPLYVHWGAHLIHLSKPRDFLSASMICKQRRHLLVIIYLETKKRACSSYKLQAQSGQRTPCVEVKTQSRHNAARCVCCLFRLLRFKFKAAIYAQAIIGLCFLVTIFAFHNLIIKSDNGLDVKVQRYKTQACGECYEDTDKNLF